MDLEKLDNSFNLNIKDIFYEMGDEINKSNS